MPRPQMRPPALSEEPPEITNRRPGVGLQLTMPLQTITPVIGGGVTPFEPDTVDGVRVPSIRGALREWWRLLFRREDDSAECLFQREAALWGGVGVKPDSKDIGALKSRVRIAVEMTELGQSVPAGVHRFNADSGQLKALPNWTIGSALGYALFPLQRQERERRDHKVRSDLPTRSVRMGASFRLKVEFAAPAAAELATAQTRQLLATLWVWMHFGGLGARTRRGFGALDLTAAAILDSGAFPDAAPWLKLFDPKDPRDLVARLMELVRLSGEPRLLRRLSYLLVSEKASNPSQVHGMAVDQLKTFRQGANVGRDPAGPGSGRSPAGRSRWPEPNLLRLAAEVSEGATGWEHEPPLNLRGRLREMAAPRAAFGLPIVMGFQPNSRDSQASAELYPWKNGKKLERWTSPLLLRPLRWKSGEYRAGMLVLDQPAPFEVKVILNTEKQSGLDHQRIVRRVAVLGSRGDIETLLTQHRGEALPAFCEWLATQGYQYVTRPQAAGGSHA